MSTQEFCPERFDCSDDEGPEDEENLDQDGNSPEAVPKEHSPYGLTTDSMLLTDHSRASVHVYVREDIKRSQRVKFDTFVEAVFGITPQAMTEWISIITKEKWHEDKVVSAQLSAFCTATREAARYEPLSDLVNRIMEMAHGRLPGVPDQYPIADICIRKNDPLYIRPIEAHRGLGAKRKPDLLTLRGRHAVNLLPPRTQKTSPPPNISLSSKIDKPPSTKSTQRGSTLSAVAKSLPQRKGRAPRRGVSKKSAASSHRSDIAPAPTAVLDDCNLGTNDNDTPAAKRTGGLANDKGTASPAATDGNNTASSSTHAQVTPRQSPTGKRASAQGVRWVDDIMNWELKGTADLEPQLTAFVEDRKRSLLPAIAAAAPSTTRVGLPAASVACRTGDGDSDRSDSDYDDDSASVGMKRRRRNHDVLESVRLPQPRVSPSMMDSEEREPFDLREAAIQTGSYALETLACTFGTRLFCVNIMMQNDRLHLWYYDACGFVCTDSISLVDDFERTAALFVGVACATPAQLGALPSVIKPPRRAPYPANWPPENLKGHTLTVPRTIRRPGGDVTVTENVQLTLQDSVFTQYIIAGRRTFVYTVKTKPQLSKGILIAKLSYQVATRWREHELLGKAANAGVGHLPTVHAWGDLWQMSEGIRGIFYDKEKTEYEDRTLRAIIYDRLAGKHTDHGVQMIDCVHDLRYKAKILHRDISVNNVMYERRNGRLYFILIDFDMATVVSDDPKEPYEPRSKRRTGTLAFMAAELIVDAAYLAGDPNHKCLPHRLRHDLESIFWLCVWCTLVMVPTESPAQREDFLNVVRAWETKDLWTIAHCKGDILAKPLNRVGINLQQAAIDAGLQPWFGAWTIVWHQCNTAIITYDLGCNNAAFHRKESPAMDWETMNGIVTRDNLRRHLTEYIPDPYAPSANIDELPVNPAGVAEAMPANVTDVPGDAIATNPAVVVAESTLLSGTANLPKGTPVVTPNVVSENVCPLESDTAEARQATNNVEHTIATDAGERRMRTRASTRLAAAKSPSPAARKVGTRRAKPVTRRARSPTREQSAEIARKANAAAKRTVKKSNAAAKKTTKKTGATEKKAAKKTGTTEKKASKKADTTEKKAVKKAAGGTKKTTKQAGTVEKAEKTVRRAVATTTIDGGDENDIRKRLRPRK